MQPKPKTTFKRLLKAFVGCFVLLNLIAFFHAYAFTHFSTHTQVKTPSAEKLSTFNKIKTLLLGVNNPRPRNTPMPPGYKTVVLQSNKQIELWQSLTHKPTKGTVVLFHGYGSHKSSLLDKAALFQAMHYQVLLVDFMGSGGSEGNQCTLGFKEAQQVKTAIEYLAAQGETRIYLFGSSMGAVAIMKALHDDPLQPKGIILECPFGSMYQTTCARFKTMGVPAFPMAGMLVFWGGVQNGFWAFGHQPTAYAKRIHCPTLLLYGAQDKTVSPAEINTLYQQLQGPKQLQVYPQAGHENYLTQYHTQWQQHVQGFLAAH